MSSKIRPVCVILTGLSGAGKSTAIKALEDIDFYCMDNIPFDLIDSATNYFLQNIDSYRNFAIGFDLRSGLTQDNLLSLKAKLETKFDLDIVFFESSKDELLTRYNATRRKHPLLEETGDLESAIVSEANALEDIRSLASWTVDTTNVNVHEFARVLEDRYSHKAMSRKLYLTFYSFGFKHGGLSPAELVFDVRFLRNPYFDKSLRSETGLSSEVQNYVFEDDRSQLLFDKIEDIVSFSVPEYYSEGKNYLRIGIGCTGGKHRSVTFAERLASAISKKNFKNVVINTIHRDIKK